jgi:hypothetical protein
MPTTTSHSGSSASTQAEPFLFLYFSQLKGTPVLHETSGERLGTVHDFLAQATMPYPTVCGMEMIIPGGRRVVPWSMIRGVTPQAVYLASNDTHPPPASDYSVHRDLIRKLAVEVSATSVVRIWDVHFVYSEGKMVLAHAETGIRGLLRTLGLEKVVMALLGSVLSASLRERFATFRHLQILTSLPDGSITIPIRVLEMHPADLASVLRQLPGRLRRQVFSALSVEVAAAVLREAEVRFQGRLLAACPRERQATVKKLMAALRDSPPL